MGEECRLRSECEIRSCVWARVFEAAIESARFRVPSVVCVPSEAEEGVVAVLPVLDLVDATVPGENTPIHVSVQGAPTWTGEDRHFQLRVSLTLWTMKGVNALPVNVSGLCVESES